MNIFFRFKDEVANVLETFVEEEDDFIKQVMQLNFHNFIL